MGRTESTVRAGESGESGGRTEERRVASVTCESVRRVTRSRSEDAVRTLGIPTVYERGAERSLQNER